MAALMEVYAPQTIIRVLAGVPLDNTYKDTFDWASLQAQTAYFSGKTKYGFDNCTYQRQTQAIRVETNPENLYDCNYIMYQNSSFGTKWFYAFITRVNYINQATAEIEFELDVMQTWWFNIEILPCFVEREHVDNDSVGAHLIDEGLALGDYVSNEITRYSVSNWWCVVGSTVDLNSFAFTPAAGEFYGNIYSAAKYYTFDNAGSINNTLELLANAGKSDAIVAMYMMPKQCAPNATNGGELTIVPAPVDNPTTPTTRTLNGYTPRNGKLYTYPYQCLYASNNDGNATTLRWEFFNTGPTGHLLEIAFGQQANSRMFLYPLNYKGVLRNLDEGIGIGGFPQCCWQQNTYANWMAMQSIRWGYQTERYARNAAVSTGMDTFTGILNGNYLAPVTSTVRNINSLMDVASKMQEEQEIHSIIPPSVKGVIGQGFTNITMGYYGFTFEAKSITKEIAKSIDGYFDMFGYKVNQLKKPNITGRPYWNYVKTIKAAVSGNAPVDSINAIRGIFDRGVTFWHGDWVGRYDLMNPASIKPNPGLPTPPDPDPPTPDPDPDPPIPPDPSEPTGLVWGVPFPDWASHVTSEFGPRVNPVTGKYENHDGIDIAYPTGTPITAIANGECIRNTSSAGRGNYGTVQTTNPTYLYIYQHCSVVNMKVGETITLGQTDVARVGATGQVTGPHLHLEIWANGTPVNPRPFLEGKFNPPEGGET